MNVDIKRAAIAARIFSSKWMNGIVCWFILSVAFLQIAVAQNSDCRERTYDVKHYKIEVSFDAEKQMVFGSVCIILSPIIASISSLELDAVNMSIQRVSIRNRKRLDYEYDSTTLRIILDRKYHYGERIVCVIKYECAPQRGLYFIQRNASYPDNPEQIWTQGHPEESRHWFPCYDYPNDKATSEAFITVDRDLTAVSNGRLATKKKNPDGTITWHWRNDKPHSTYLIMIAVGRYRIFEDKYDNVPIHSYYYPTDSLSDVRRCFTSTSEIMKFFSKYIGIKYPWAKYAQIPVAHFPYGGMENTSATILADSRAVVDARTAIDYSPEPLIAHELAHQWWGDYVTNIDWENSWLNEGFATYYQQLWTRYKYGDDEFQYQRYEGIQSYLNWADVQPRIPVVTAKGLFRPNIYSKGAAVLHMLSGIVGEESFRRVIKKYGKKHAFGCVETNDLKRMFENSAWMDLSWFFDQWLYKAGYPDIVVTRRWDETQKKLSLIFSQEQKTDSLCGYFKLPIDLLIMDSTGFHNRSVWIDGHRDSVDIMLASKPDMLVIDHGSNICGRIRSNQTTEELMYQLVKSPDLVKRIEAGLQLIQSCKDPVIRKILFTVCKTDPFHGVRFKIATALTELNPDTVQYSVELKELFISLIKDKRSKIRSTAFNGLSKYKDESLKLHFESGLQDSSYYVEAAAMNCIVGIDSLSALSHIHERLFSASYRDILALAALELVGRYRFIEEESALIQLAGRGGSVELRAKALRTLHKLGVNPTRLKEILVEQLQEPAPEIRMLAISALIEFFQFESIEILNQHIKDEKDIRIINYVKRIFKSG